MSIILTDEQYILWIKDPSVSPYINNDVDYYDRKWRKNILNLSTLNNPRSFLNKIIMNAFSNTSARQKIVEQIKEYKENKKPRLFMQNDKWKYDKEDLIKHNIVDMDDYMEPYFNEDECKRWVRNHLVNPRTQDSIKQNGYIYIELIYMTLQYGIDISEIENNLLSTPSSINKIADTKDIIQNVRFRLQFMKETDELFLRYDIKSFDDLLVFRSLEIIPAKKPKSKNTFSVSSYSSSPIKSINSDEKKQLGVMALIKDEQNKKLNEYMLQKKHQKTLQKNMEMQNVNKHVFSSFRTLLVTLDEDLLINMYKISPGILKDINEDEMKKITDVLRKFYKQYPRSDGTIEDLSNNLDNILRIARRFIVNIYQQLLNPRNMLDTKIAAFSYRNKNVEFSNMYSGVKEPLLIQNITSTLEKYVDDFNQAMELDEEIKKYFKMLVYDIIPINYVAHGSLNRPEMIDKRAKVFIEDDGYQNYYYYILNHYSESIYNNIQYRLPVGEGLINGNILTRKFATIKYIHIYKYFNADPEYKIIIKEDNKDNDFTYKECLDWVIMPIINPRTFEPISIDSPIYNRLLCMTYQYDCNLIPRMITSRGYEIIKALIYVIKHILLPDKKPQTREELEMYILNKKLQRKKDTVKDIPDVVGLKWKMVGTKKPTTGIEIIDKKFKVAFLKSTDKDGVPPFYVLFSEQDFAKFGITDITKDSYIEIATYYIPAIHTRKGTTNNVGMRWKRINDEKWKQDIQKGSVQIKSKGLAAAFLRTTGQGSKLPGQVLFSEDEFAKFGITTKIAKNGYFKFAYYYKPVVNNEKGSPTQTITRTANYITTKTYNIIECMRWAMNPNRDPKIPTQLILTDSQEYQDIFEQALLFNPNIQPIGITSKGIEFKKQILKQKEKNFQILKVKSIKPADEISQETKDDIVTKNEICESINNIYTYTENKEVDKEYLYFRKKMLEMCYKYLGKKVDCNLPNINKELNDKFVKKKRTSKTQFFYYEDSALASVIVDYTKRFFVKLYNEDEQNNYINNYKNIHKVVINELVEIEGSIIGRDKGAIDVGGVSREFFTNFFEELFCDEENKKRPFILPEEKSNTNRYYINPNFEPDEKFRKVINYAQKKYHKRKKLGFNTEEDYQLIYYIIGKVLSVTLVNIEIGTPKQFSSYILSRFINPQKKLTYYDILYFYLRDFNNSKAYINMMNEQEKNTIDLSGFSFNDYYIITKASQSNPLGRLLTKENYPKYLLQLAKHIVTKNFLFDGVEGSDKNMKGRYESLFSGFNNELRTFLHNNKVSIDTLDKLITNDQLNETILLEFAEKLKISVIKFVDDNIFRATTVPTKTEEEKQAIIADMKTCMANIITINRIGKTQEEHYKFIRRLLQFWTGFNYYDKRADNEENGYKVFYFYGSDVRRYSSTHTCFYQLDFFGFPDDMTTIEEKEDFLYEKLIESINNAPGMEMA
jgi:hypothetical protein